MTYDDRFRLKPYFFATHASLLTRCVPKTEQKRTPTRFGEGAPYGLLLSPWPSNGDASRNNTRMRNGSLEALQALSNITDPTGLGDACV